MPVHVLRANSYADLLKPIDKASEFLAHSMSSAPRADEGRVELTRYRHHHHHHHHYRRRTHHRDQQDEYVRIR